MAGASAVFILLVVLAIAWGDRTALLVAGLTASAVGFAVMGATTRERRLLDESRSDVRRQVESLLWLQGRLDREHPLPPTGGWAASPDLLVEIVRLVDERPPRVVVEFGSGVSTLVIAQQLRAFGAGRLISFDHDPAFASQTRRRLKDAGLDDYAVVIDAPLGEVPLGDAVWDWYQLPDGAIDGSVDLVVVDGPPSIEGRLSRYPALPVLAERLGQGAVILVDDGGRLDEQEMVRRWEMTLPIASSEYLPLDKGAFRVRMD